MAKELSPEVLRRLARLGAQARLDQLEAERTAILQAFPELTGGQPAAKPRRRRRGRPAKAAAQAAAPKPPSAKPRGRKARKKRASSMSAEARARTSERMKKYWAERRAADAGAKG